LANVWEEIFKKEGSLFKGPHPEIAQIAQLFKTNGIKRVLDIGSGQGRHIVYLASRGFDVYGLDISSTGLAYCLQALCKKGLSAHVTLHDMITLPYDDEYFDAVISIQVIHHNKISNIIKTIEEITRVLRNRGIIWITVPVSKDKIGSKFKEIEPQTFIPLNGREKGLPHHYFTKEELTNLFPRFSLIDLHVDQFNHFSLTAKKIS
jgi:cyclopropane fatty-acyl-phospholipid synthase-like methyltransferase